jgi:hypothetical protein
VTRLGEFLHRMNYLFPSGAGILRAMNEGVVKSCTIEPIGQTEAPTLIGASVGRLIRNLA